VSTSPLPSPFGERQSDPGSSSPELTPDEDKSEAVSQVAGDTLYRLLTEHSQDVILLHSPKGECLFASPSFFQTLGYKWEDIAGSMDFVHPDDRNAFLKFLQRSMEGSNPSVRLVCRFTKRDGSILWFETLASRLVHPDVKAAIMTTSRDITHRREAQEALKESEEQFRLVFDGLPIPMVLAEFETWEVLEGNEAFERLLDLRVSDLAGVSFWSFAVKEPELAADLLRQLDLSSRAVSGAVEFQHRQGEIRKVIITAFVLQQRTGSQRVLCAVDDITEHARTEQEIENYRRALEMRNSQLEQMLRETSRLAEEASAASTAKTAFLAAVSHEIRTPLHGIVGATDLLLDFPLSEDVRELLCTIRSCGSSLTGLINGLLDFSSIEGGRMQCETVPFSPRLLIESVRGVLLPRALAKGLLLSCQVDKNVPVAILGDPQRIEQVLLNLVENAVKFTPAGHVELSVHLDDCQGELPQIQFVVRDTGPGIPQELHADIFSPFVQGDARPSRRHGGVGLGLAICRELSRLMKGDVSLSSTSPSGTCFLFTIPLEEPQDMPGNLREEPALPKLTTQIFPALRILIVEDNVVNQRIASLMLGKTGCISHVASNGEEALDILSRLPFDAVLMDCQMPVMDGYETTRRIRATTSPVLNPEIPIIAMTGNAMAGDRETCLAAGMSDYLTKPVKIVSIREAFARCLPHLFGKA